MRQLPKKRKDAFLQRERESRISTLLATSCPFERPQVSLVCACETFRFQLRLGSSSGRLSVLRQYQRHLATVKSKQALFRRVVEMV